VAVILSLMLIVLFIANYISVTLPNTMGQNDLQHEVQVQNQVATFSALLHSVASAGIVGAQVSQPVTLGSASAPPFAAPDSAYFSAANQSQGLKVNYTVLGPQVFNAPYGGSATNVHIAACSYPTASTISCSGSTYTLYYNFTGSAVGSSPYTVSLVGTGAYLAYLNFSVNSSTITLNSKSPTMSLLVLNVFGSGNTVSVPLSNATETIVLLGNSNTLTLVGSGTGHTDVLVVGNSNTVTNSATGTGHVYVSSFYGMRNSFQPGTPGNTNTFGVFFTGLNASSPGYGCPNDNLAGTSSVAQPSGTSTSTYVLTYNNTTGTPSTGSIGKWTTVHNSIPATQFACPFYALSKFAVPGSVGATSASFIVHLLNTYQPSSEVAFDQGAVVYSQGGAAPIFVAPPSLSYTYSTVTSTGVLTVFVPAFENTIGSESGVGTVDVSARLASMSKVTIPSNGFILPTGSQITVTISTPYAAVWYSYFLALPNPLSLMTVTCTGSNNVCSLTTLYKVGGPIGTVTLRFPSSGITLTVLSALYSVSIS